MNHLFNKPNFNSSTSSEGGTALYYVLTPEQEAALLNREIPEGKWWDTMSRLYDPGQEYSKNLSLMNAVQERLHTLRRPTEVSYSPAVFAEVAEDMAIPRERLSDLLDSDIPAQPTKLEAKKMAAYLDMDDDLVEAYFVYQREVLASALKTGTAVITWPIVMGEVGWILLEAIDAAVDEARVGVKLPEFTSDQLDELLLGIISWPVEGWLSTLEKETSLSKGTLLRWACWKADLLACELTV